MTFRGRSARLRETQTTQSMKHRRIPAAIQSALCATAVLVASPAGALTVEVSADADLTVTENADVPSGTASDSSSSGGNTQLNARHNGPTDPDKNEIIVLRFDLTGNNRSTIESAELQLTNYRGGRDNSGRPLRFWGVNDGATGYNAITASEGPATDNDWPENSTIFSTTPGLEFDADSGTRGVRSDRVTDLGLRPGPVGEEDEGSLATLATTELTDFLVNHPDDIVTILVEVEADSNGQMRYASKEADSLDTIAGTPGEFAPTLVLEIVPVPFLGVTPTEAYEGDPLDFSWFAPVGATNLMITPGGIDAPGNTDETGLGSAEIPAPAGTTTYTFSYDFEGSPASFEQEVTILPPFLEVGPALAVHDVTTLSISWRVPPAAEQVSLDFGPDGGPYDTIDVTNDTDPLTGAGSYPFLVPFEGEDHYELRYTINSVEVDPPLMADIELVAPIFSSVFAFNTVGDLKTVPRLEDGVLIYQDRSNFTWDNVPDELIGAQVLSPWNDDKNQPGISIEVTAAQDATLYLIVDNRVGNGEAENPTSPTLGAGVMDWAVSAGFVDTGLKIDGFPDLNYSIFARPIAMGETVVAGEQADGDTRVLYSLAGVAPPVTTRFVASPAEIDEGGSTTLHWLVPAGSTVSIDQGVGPVTTDPTTGTGSLEVTPSSTGAIPYTLTYDPPGSDPEDTLGPVVVTVNATAAPADFLITSVRYDATSGEVDLTWPAPAGVTDPGLLTDTVAASTGLDGSWEAVTDGILSITDGVVSFTDPSPLAGDRVFYQVERP